MRKGIKGIDHVGIDPLDVWQAFARFTRLGFTVSTPARFLGLPVESCQVTFPGIFLSISKSFVDASREDTEWVARTKPAGITELLLGTGNIRQLELELMQECPDLMEGHAMAEVHRQVYLGRRTFPQKFRILVLDPAKVEGVGTIGFCEHETPELVWREELLSHPNTAESISTLTFVHADPPALQGRFSTLLGDASAQVSTAAYERKLDEVKVEFVTEDSLRGRLPEFDAWSELRAPDLKVIGFQISDARRTRDYFDFMGVDYLESDETLYVQPAEACGFLLSFHSHR